MEFLAATSRVSAIILAGVRSDRAAAPTLVRGLGASVTTVGPDLLSGEGMAAVLEATRTPYLLLIFAPARIRFAATGDLCDGIERLLSVASDCGAALVFSDYFAVSAMGPQYHSLIDYQFGSIRDGFDFGGAVLLSKDLCVQATGTRSPSGAAVRWGSFYDLRLKLSVAGQIIRIPEPLYTVKPEDRTQGGERQFDYVDPKQRDYQMEMERIATDHLKNINAYLRPEFPEIPSAASEFPVDASVVIPVRNRERTIRDAVTSALSQRTNFSFNVIAVDNHSSDTTTEILAEVAAQDRRLIHIKPARVDLGIGGCWNEAIFSTHCGKIAVQLDSDDLYSSDQALGTIVGKFKQGPYAMVIGSYKITNFELQEIPPGLIDHREWTRENGRNNALRINGLGAPRAFYVPLLRQFGLPNTSYGEDYAIALRISREYEIGRIYEPLYFARRWEGNSDAQLDLTTANRYDTYKDRLRTLEIMARQRKNGQ